MNCPKCNSVIGDDSNFCNNCGAKIDLGECTIKVTRISKAFGFAITFTALVDGVEIGKLNNGTSIECKVPKGTHKVVINSFEKDTEQEVTLSDTQKEVEISVCVGMGIVAGRPKIVSVEYR